MQLRLTLALLLALLLLLALTPGTHGAPVLVPAPAQLTGARLDFAQPADWLYRNAARLGPRKLTQVVLPGAHDAASYSVPAGARVCPARMNPLASLASFFMVDKVHAQEVPIAAQLAAGVRYLDLRVCALRDGPGPTRYFVHHTFLGAALETVLAEVDAFTRAHPREVVILDFQHLNGFNPQDRRWLARTLETRLGPRLLATTTDLGTVTLAEMWAGQASVVALMEEAPAASQRVFDRAENLDSHWFDVASVNGLLEALATFTGTNPNRLHVLQWQLTPGSAEFLSHPFDTLKDFARGPNGLISDGTLRKLVQPSKMNVVMTDDVSSVVESIARLND